jgi:hypothetical protein
MIRLLAATAAAALLATPALAQDPHAGHQMPMPAKPAPSTADQLAEVSETPTSAPPPQWGSGTSWQPAVTPHTGVHLMAGPWMVMSHLDLNLVYDSQQGPRGGDKAFAAGMIMSMAQRDVGQGTLQLRAMLSPDPFMGRSGYPLLLASGETADGVHPLVDRQHPHDLFMELSGTLIQPLGPGQVLLYAGLPGEPAFGPPAFMHRLSIMDSPEAPISHHWLDSTHIVFGVVTAGYVYKDWKVEVSRFKGREPDDHRWDIENPKLDSTSARLSFNPTERLALQASWAQVKSPEQLEPEQDQTKWSASAIYTVPLGPNLFGQGGWWSTTAAWGRRSAEHDDLNAYALESAVKPNDRWTVFGRAERTENNELTGAAGHHGATYTVGKVSVGAIRDWRVSQHLKVGLGGLYAWNFVPGGLEGAYGGDPNGAMAFVRLKVE